MQDSKQKILIVLPRQLGDILLGLPMAKALIDAAGEASVEIHWYAHPMGKLVLEQHPWVYRSHYYPVVKKGISGRALSNFLSDVWKSAKEALQLAASEVRFLNLLRREKFSAVIDVMNNPRTAIATYYTGAPLRISFESRWNRSWAYNVIVSRGLLNKGYVGNARLQLLTPLLKGALFPMAHAFLAEFEGANFVAPKTQLFPLETECIKVRFFLQENKLQEKGFFAFAPAHRHAVRKWKAEYFCDLAELLWKEFLLPIVWLWGPGEEAEVVDLHNELCRRNITSICAPLFNLRETAYLCGLGLCFFGNSSGLSHVATAGGAKTVVVHGPTSPQSWEYPNPTWHLGLQRSIGCTNCGKNVCKLPERECLDELLPMFVFQRVRNFLGTLY